VSTAASKAASVRLSVVIPTRGRPDRLRACLATLAAARAPEGGWEVVVVDDGSDPPLQTPIGQRGPSDGPLAPGDGPRGRSDGPPVRVAHQAPSGLNAARNRGVLEARGELVAFLDDDTLVDPNWARAISAAFAETGCDAVAGRVVLRLEDAAPRWLTPKLRRYLAEYDQGDVARPVLADPVPVGANCAVRREVWSAAGGFAAGLDRAGTSLLSNGDTEFFRRLLTRGASIRYVPEARVEHCVAAERLTAQYFRRRAYAQGASDALLGVGATGRPGSMMRETIRAGRSAPIAARGVLEGRGATTAHFWIQYCRGRMSVIRAEDGASR
jgi:glycosyltransferase involved in cell wall biosynthesis